MAEASAPLSASLTSLTAASILLLSRAGNLVLIVLEHFLRAIDGVVRLVALLDFLACASCPPRRAASASLRIFSISSLREAAAGGDGDLLLLAGAQVLGADVQDAVGVNVEGHFDLRHAARGRRDVRQMELADGLVVAGQLAFALEHVDFHAGLIVRGGGEDFRFAGGNGRVALDKELWHRAQAPSTATDHSEVAS